MSKVPSRDTDHNGALRGGTLSRLRRSLLALLPRRLVNSLRTYRDLKGPAGRIYARRVVWRALGLEGRRQQELSGIVRSVLFVCHGNKIRSPLAAALLRKYLAEFNCEPLSVLSAGLHADPSDTIDPRALVVAKEFGISLEHHQVQPMTPELLEKSDVVFVMDFKNEAELIARSPESKCKIHLLGLYSGREGEVEISDPYGGELSDIRGCYESLRTCVQALARSLCGLKQRGPRPDRGG